MYDEQHPYENRDPRFEECIMHHGSPYVWDKAYTLDISAGGINFRSTLPTDNTQTRTGYYYCKTIPPNCTLNGKQTGRGPKQYKLSEMILNFAECALNADHLEEAMEAVNEIRARVHMPPLPEELALNKEKLRLRVYNERRVELAFEEARYYDLRRRCKPEEEIPGIKYFSAMGVTYAGDWSAATYTRVPLREAGRHGYEPQCKLSPLPKGAQLVGGKLPLFAAELAPKFHVFSVIDHILNLILADKHQRTLNSVLVAVAVEVEVQLIRELYVKSVQHYF